MHRFPDWSRRTAILLFWQDKSAPRYIKIYENEQ